jgi:hypothetical protein
MIFSFFIFHLFSISVLNDEVARDAEAEGMLRRLKPKRDSHANGVPLPRRDCFL